LLGFREVISGLFLTFALLVAAAACLAVPSPGSLAAAGTGTGLCVEPAVLRLDYADSRRQLLVSRDGVDATHDCRYVSSDPAVVRVEDGGYVVPVGAGQARITVGHEGDRVEVPVSVTAYDAQRPIDFGNEVVPLFSRFGCNAGGCHGKASGQNGFKLSLLGFDPAVDYDAIVLDARGRRVFPAAPGESLLLRKATARVPHGGGRRLELEGDACRLIARWIAQGLPRSVPGAPPLVGLTIAPRERVLHREAGQQLAVLAEYGDGRRQDVTRQCQFSSNVDVVAAVDERGLVRGGARTGEAAIMARYMGQVAVFRAQVPRAASPGGLTGFVTRGAIDERALARWQQLGLAPSPTAADATFLRRVTIDLCGRLPTAAEARGFLADPDPTPAKRERLVDRLLDSPDYPAYFAMRWGTILRNSSVAESTEAAYAFHAWIKSMIARNRPYDEFVRGVVGAAGEWQEAPAINWLWQMRDDLMHQTASDTAQVFLGIRLQCARCHHHPYERWGQPDYYGLAGFFTRVGPKSKIFGQPPAYYSATRVVARDKDPLTGRAPEPKYLDGPAAQFAPEQDPRQALVDWMADPANPWFARALVNRMWGHFFGRGIVEPVDDMRETNPPSNPQLLDDLARDFVAHRFDVKHLIRTIVTSNTYQRDAAPLPDNEQDEQNFARFYARRLIAEVLYDAVDQACGTHTKFPRMGPGARAVDLPHEGFNTYFLTAFDRPKRVSGCECERSSGATLGQVLLLSNSDEIEDRIAAPDGIIARLVAQQRPAPEIIDELYLGALGRFPNAAERARALVHVQQASDPRPALEDVLWALVNSKEFLFNH